MPVPKIYAANVEDVGKPITSTKRKATKKSDTAPLPETGSVPSEAPKETKPKRVRKKADPKVSEPVPEATKETPQSPISLDEKVKKPARKRAKKSVDAQSSSTENIDILLDEALSESVPIKKEKKVKSMTPPPSVVDDGKKIERKVAFADDTQPPAWFKSYIQGVREEEALLSANKVSKKVTKALANDEAAAKWKEPVTRERVNRSIDTHMQKMYANIFPNRRF